uniref:GPI-anchored protein LLG1-like domain-containing protein n=1 Tax=Kalanchoe fedtschenkoi TaxID=63787 RepID=A0A7N0RE90_KALFE
MQSSFQSINCIDTPILASTSKSDRRSITPSAIFISAQLWISNSIQHSISSSSSSSSSCPQCLFFFLVLGFSTASANHISDDVFGCRDCPVNLELLNYTILTEQCQAPKYPPNKCCTAFKKLACPVSEELNDLDTDCADALFNYIYLNGHYPPGLFANECHEGKEGLDCTSFITSPPAAAAAATPFSQLPLTLLLGLIILLPLQI